MDVQPRDLPPPEDPRTDGHHCSELCACGVSPAPRVAPSTSYPNGRRFPAGARFWGADRDAGVFDQEVSRAMYHRASGPRYSLRSALRHTLVPRRQQRGRGVSPAPPVGRVGIRPLPGESIADWVKEEGWSEVDDEPFQDPGERVWGKTPGHAVIRESDVRSLQSERLWKPHIMSAWLAWWALYHPDVPAGTWVAPVGTIHRAFRQRTPQSLARILPHQVETQLPQHMPLPLSCHMVLVSLP